MVCWLVSLVANYLSEILLSDFFYEPFYSTIFVYLCVSDSVCFFINHCSGGEPVGDLDLQFIVESEQLDPKFKNTSGNLKI